ncbi:hypothetical protein TGPRC2_423690 [Toxoplasma gondii TgCatPRC2]|uniref:Uncharacterized protein n=1 Tax=Toxoplasma gondii TgCatPRC2 TaxID=1130821 RepID=A0A151HLV6_TOXGO|nr:hypothetical protein TGPRC2_423690 [Toxoplasma gondii TgCatPRC2]
MSIEPDAMTEVVVWPPYSSFRKRKRRTAALQSPVFGDRWCFWFTTPSNLRYFSGSHPLDGMLIQLSRHSSESHAFYSLLTLYAGRIRSAENRYKKKREPIQKKAESVHEAVLSDKENSTVNMQNLRLPQRLHVMKQCLRSLLPSVITSLGQSVGFYFFGHISSQSLLFTEYPKFSKIGCPQPRRNADVHAYT